MGRALALGALLVVVPGAALAQTGSPPNPNNPSDFTRNASPGMPWSGITSPGRESYGSVIRQIEVAVQQLVIQAYVPGPGSLPGQYQPQVVEIPGYVVTETTTGFIYPERWGLQQVTYGVYRWVKLPQQFQRK